MNSRPSSCLNVIGRHLSVDGVPVRVGILTVEVQGVFSAAGQEWMNAVAFILKVLMN